MRCHKCNELIINGVGIEVRVDVTRNPREDDVPHFTLYRDIYLCSKCSIDEYLEEIKKDIKYLAYPKESDDGKVS